MKEPIAQGPVDVNVRGWKGKRMHKNLGEVFVTVDCLALQLQNPDPTSIFVEHNGEIKEVSRSMMEAPNAKVSGAGTASAGLPG